MTETAMDVDTKSLPPGWKWVKLEELEAPEKSAFKIGPFGSSLKKTELVDSGIPICGIPNVLPNNFLPGYHRFISPEKYQQLYDYTVKPGDVLVTTMGTIGRAAVVPAGIEPMIYDSHIFRMRVDTSVVEPSLLSYAINGLDDLSYQIRSRSAGGIMAGLNSRILRTCYLALPPLKEQKRIAAILDEQMAAVEKAKKAAEERLEAAKALPAAYLREAFEGEEAKEWPNFKLGEICFIQLGKMLSPKSRVTGEGVPYLRNVNVQWGDINTTDLNRMDFDSREQNKFRLQNGDLIVCEGGEPGRAAVWKGQIEDMYYQKALHRLRPKIPCNTEFLRFSFQYGSTVGMFTDQSYKTTIAHIPLVRLKEISIGLPSKNKQDEIVEGLIGGFSGVEALEQSIQQELETIETMPAALLRKAFAGEL